MTNDKSTDKSTDMIAFTSLAHTTQERTTVRAASVFSFDEYVQACLDNVVETPVCPPSGVGSTYETIRVSA